MRQGHAHVALDGVGGQEGLRVHGVQVVHAVQEAAGATGLPQGAVDGVMEDDAAERSDMHRA